MKQKYVSVITFFLFFFFLHSLASAFTSTDYTNAGLQIYAKKDYVLAARYFTAALGMTPVDPRALQSRANCNYFLGKNQEALADYEKILASNPSGPVSQFVQALRAKVGSAAAPAGAATPGLTTPVSTNAESVSAAAVQKPAGLGLRLEPALAMVNLADFTADATTSQADAAQYLLLFPASTYKFTETVPSAFVNVCLEPVAKVGSNFEIGLPFSIMPVGNVSSSAQDTFGYNNSVSYSISAFSIGLNGRFIFGPGPLKVFAAAGGMMVPIGISYTNILNQAGFSTISGSGDFSGSAFGGQAQFGFDFHVGEPFVLSIFGGYLSASANSFKGTITVSGNGPTTTNSYQMGVVDSTNGKRITFLKDGDPTPNTFRPLQIDLSGIMAGIHLVVFF